MLDDGLNGPVAANELESALRADVFNALREVSAEEEGEVDEGFAGEVEDCADVRAVDYSEWFDAVCYVSDERGLVYQDVLPIRKPDYTSVPKKINEGENIPYPH